MVKAQPRLLLHRGRLLPGALRAERVTEEELRAAVRAQSAGWFEELGAVVLETDGPFSVLRGVGDRGPGSAIANVRGAAVGEAPGTGPAGAEAS